MQNNGDFIGMFYFMNTIANTASAKYLSYYIEETNWFYFNNDLGATSDLYLSEY